MADIELKDAALIKAEDEDQDPYAYWGMSDRAPGQQAEPEAQSKIVPSAVVPRREQEQEKLSPEDWRKLEQLAPVWLENYNRQKMKSADPRYNPVLYGEGKKKALLDNAAGQYHQDFKDHTSSDEYQGHSNLFDKWRSQLGFLRDWHSKNSDVHSDAVDALNQAQQVHDLSNRARLNERKESLAHAGESAGAPTMGQHVAATHLGVGAEDEDAPVSIATIRDPGAAFASKHGGIVEQERKKLADVKQLTPEEEEQLHAEGASVPMLKHPAFEDPENRSLVNRFYAQHGGPMRDENIRKVMKNLNIDESLSPHIDMGRLGDAAMHGLLEGVHSWRDDVGTSRGNHMRNTANNFIRTELQRQHPIAQNLRAKAKAADEAKKQESLKTAPVKVFSPEEKAKLQAQYAAQGKTKVSPTALMNDQMKGRMNGVSAARSSVKKPEGEGE